MEREKLRSRLRSGDEEDELLASVRSGGPRPNARLKHRRRHLSTGDGEPIIR